MKEKLVLRPPQESDEAAIVAYTQAFLERGESTDGSAGVHKVSDSESYAHWLADIRRNNSEETVAPGLVPATTLVALHPADGSLVGFLDIRHRLNDHLLAFGGHIGYSVHPQHRRKGYATAMLAMGLDYCRDTLGLDRVLVTCNQENVASARTILANGGVQEDERPREGGGVTQRYWIVL